MIPKKRILIVDPSPASLVWQLVLLQEERYDTLTATQAEEGIRIARMELPDLILLDVASSPAEGMAACRTLRRASETSHIPILVITSNGFGSGLSRADVGFDERITKPFDGVEYLTKIRRCLERPMRREA
ncbi:MAG: response regulator [Gemmatimonadaceae bacterium]